MPVKKRRSVGAANRGKRQKVGYERLMMGLLIEERSVLIHSAGQVPLLLRQQQGLCYQQEINLH